jgi:hypothetical protein
MDRLVCPHCHSGRLAGAPVPKDVVVVMPCPACSGLVVMFRKKALALDRKILQAGSQQDRKMHIAGIIAEFLEPGLLKFATASGDFEPEPDQPEAAAKVEISSSDKPPISEDEVREFARVALRRIDDGEYFKRHLS